MIGLSLSPCCTQPGCCVSGSTVEVSEFDLSKVLASIDPDITSEDFSYNIQVRPPIRSPWCQCFSRLTPCCCIAGFNPLRM